MFRLGAGDVAQGVVILLVNLSDLSLRGLAGRWLDGSRTAGLVLLLGSRSEWGTKIN